LRQSGTGRAFSLRAGIAWAGAWLAVFALALWLRQLTPVWIVATILGAAAWLFGRGARRPWWSIGTDIALLAAAALALGLQLRLGEIARSWSTIRFAVEDEAADAIGEALDDLVDRGTRAVDGVTRVAESLPPRGSRAAAFARLDALRRETRISALAIYGPDANPIVWAGEHRGLIPRPVRLGEFEYSFHRGPLFGYLYFAHPLPEGRTAIAAVLLESSIPTAAEQAPFAARFTARHGIEPRFMAPERAEGDAVWDWTTERRILSVAFAQVTQEAWHARTATQGRWLVGAAWLTSILLLGIGWYRRSIGAPGVPIAVMTASLFLLPLGDMLATRGLFSPLNFVLPGPGDVTLGQLLILVAGASLWLLVRTPSAIPARMPSWLRIGVAAAAVPLVLEVMRRSTSDLLLSTQPAGGFALVFAAVFLIAIPLFLMFLRPAPVTPSGSASVPLAAGVLITAVLSLAVVHAWQPERSIPVWSMALWSVPFALCYVGLRRTSGRWRLLPWLLAGWLAGTAATSYLWTLHLDARVEAAEAELARLGTEPDPYLDFLLRQFAARAQALAAEGEFGVDLLYRAWVTSGLAREGYEARLTTWRGEQPEAELAFSDLQLPDEFIGHMLTRALANEDFLLERYTEHEGLHYLLLLPLPDERVISVATPPRRRLGRATPLARFLHPEETVPASLEYDGLALVPVPLVSLGDGQEHRMDVVHWVRTRDGWRSEAIVGFPTGPMHAHLYVVVPSSWMLVVRGLLALVLILASLALLWALARTLCGEPFGLAVKRWHWIRTFRGHLTLALFGFFLLPTLVLGAVAYSALSQQAVRTGAALALRSLELAAPDVAMQPLSELGARLRSDLLLYRDGGLAGASAPEVIDLGLFQSWLPPAVEIAFATGEETEALEDKRLAGNRYLVAYRRVGDDGALAAPVPLASGEIARMQREFAHGFLLMMLAGAGLSVVLALLVGRALSRPIELLSRATAAVGAGNLRLRLPEDRPDEFGGVYRAFNRMVRRLRRARADEVRTARVLAWGEMARQVAHEIKNPLTPIKLSVQHLRRAYGDRRPDFESILDRNVEAILREIDRLSQIARAFARFGAPRAEAGTLEPVELDRVVEETLVLYRGGKDVVQYHHEIPSGVPRVLVRDGELREVLLNLLENAREAVDGDGRIEICAAPVGGGEWVRLDVRDNGMGIPSESLPRIFEPQFSTRTSGTGLGLAIVRRLVESWGGQISATSEPGQGTTIHLRLRAESRSSDAPSRAVLPG
jgi:signal transduction histidine kinase